MKIDKSNDDLTSNKKACRYKTGSNSLYNETRFPFLTMCLKCRHLKGHINSFCRLLHIFKNFWKPYSIPTKV